jgi:hypothetical protein
MVHFRTAEKHANIEKPNVHCHFTSFLSCVNCFGRDMVFTVMANDIQSYQHSPISAAIRKQWKQLKLNAHVNLLGLKLNVLSYLIKSFKEIMSSCTIKSIHHSKFQTL